MMYWNESVDGHYISITANSKLRCPTDPYIPCQLMSENHTDLSKVSAQKKREKNAEVLVS